MGWWQLSTDTLAASRFTVSAFAETTASLGVLHRGSPSHPGERAWFRAHFPAYQQLLERQPLTALLIRSAWRPRYGADFMAPVPRVVAGRPAPDSGDRGFHAELRRVRETPAEVARADVAFALGRRLPEELLRADLAELAADLLEWAWRETVRPYWERRRRILEADVVYRVGQLGQRGWAETLDALRPGMRWLGRSRLQINRYDYPPRELPAARLLFVPVTSDRGWVTWEGPDHYAVVYPCAGALVRVERPEAPEALGRLLGPARARVLLLLDAPKSTTQLVALTGQGLGSVGRHLRVLLDAGLVGRRRSGRSVLYFRAAAGDALVHAQLPSSAC
ncbi:ArsR family transcriptional regulator [Streptomyces sp. AJS327]|uniref:ArsR/SmtB family transcription factor n=1 Tax=Streptomyces sp. AJS327 TaxID=2545265 RepID=UPI0015E00AF6|nr:winged helix-turn-helix domain-containing protein [Streptomyces sp. AJS327]MBA0053970.1 ArsR family transcriptional regulator [Streptomyces sp. AJS327]